MTVPSGIEPVGLFVATTAASFGAKSSGLILTPPFASPKILAAISCAESIDKRAA